MVPLGSKEPQAVNVVAVGALGLYLTEHLLVVSHDPKVDRQLLDRDALLPRHFLHESSQKVALVEEARHPELANGEGVVRSEFEQLADVGDSLVQIFDELLDIPVTWVTIHFPIVRYLLLLQGFECHLCLITVLPKTFHRCYRVVQVGPNITDQQVVPLYFLR